MRPVSDSAHPLVGLAAAAQEESNDCLSFYIYAHIPLQCHHISEEIHRLGMERHLITLLQPSVLCDLEFVNHTVSHTSARTTSPHKALPRIPLSPPHPKEQLKSFCSLIMCAFNNNNKNQETIPRYKTPGEWNFISWEGLWKHNAATNSHVYFPLPHGYVV